MSRYQTGHILGAFTFDSIKPSRVTDKPGACGAPAAR
jgi:hypothetical protein